MTSKRELKRAIVTLARIVRDLAKRVDDASNAANYNPDNTGSEQYYVDNYRDWQACDDIVKALGKFDTGTTEESE